MELLHDLEKKLSIDKPIALTIGNFDGVHLGHQYLFSQLKQAIEAKKGKTVVITFANHPHEILKSHFTLSRICSLEHKIKLIQEQGIDHLVLLTFTQEFSQQTPEEFLNRIEQFSPFNYLILGEDAAIGKNREGDRKIIQDLSQQLRFEVRYLEKQSIHGEAISSSIIRAYIQAGNLKKAAEMLGRPYSIYNPIQSGNQLGRKLGFPTLNIDISDLCLPPSGVYAVKLKQNGGIFNGVANLGTAPSVRHDQKIVLEAHLYNQEEIEIGKPVEVIFFEFLREEKYFSQLEDLKKQIQKDIDYARECERARGSDKV